jgi:AraC-like DNA-binding protein
MHPAQLRLLCTAVQERGHDLDTVLALADMTWPELQRSETLLPLQRLRWVLLALQRAAGSPTLGLEAGRRMPLLAMGRLGALLAASPDARRALQALLRFMPQQLPLVDISVSPGPGGLWCHLAPRVPLGELQGFVLDHALATMGHVFETVAGRPLHDAALELPFPAPPWRRAYEALAGSTRFGAGRLAWWLPDSLLDQPRRDEQPDDLVFAAAWQACEDAENEPPVQASVTVQVDRWLQAAGSTPPTLDAAAAHLEVAPRTLIRRLAREGSSFQHRLDAWRREQALALLRQTDTPVAQIANRLGYRNATNFSRCIRRWFGATPRSLRQGGATAAA